MCQFQSVPSINNAATELSFTSPKSYKDQEKVCCARGVGGEAAQAQKTKFSRQSTGEKQI